MNESFPGILIRQRRLQRGWSQEGLCKGICAVSYLSKIESGHAEPGPQIAAQLLRRLGADWLTDAQELRRSQELADALWEDALSFEQEAGLRRLDEQFRPQREHWLYGPQMLDFLLLERFFDELPEDTLAPFERQLTPRQRALRLALNQQGGEALRVQPEPLYYLLAGLQDYMEGRNTRAVARLTHACTLAAAEGRVRIMLHARVFMGSCYCNLKQFAAMQEHYAVARRLAQTLGEKHVLRDMDYNTACTDLQLGRVEEAYRFFAAQPEPTAMDLHKLAICCEKLGRREEALCALSRAEQAPWHLSEGLAGRMCAPVRFRLEHPDYLQREEYGAALLALFEELRRTMPCGYAQFHFEWVAEWYTARRQYRALAQLYRDFPASGEQTQP